MNYSKEAIKRGVMGASIGVFINQAIFVCIAFKDGLSGNVSIQMMVNEFFISAILGFGIAAASIVFSIEKWSALRKTIVHFIIMSIFYFPASILGSWMPEDVVGKIGYVFIFILIYIICWFSYKIYWTRKLRELNYELKKRN